MLTLQTWITSTLAVLVASYILSGVSVENIFVAGIVSLILGLINIWIRPVMIFFTLPITILSLGLFTFVINALLVLFTDYIVTGFEVENFWWALLFSLVVSVLNGIFLKMYNDYIEGQKKHFQ